MKKVITYGTYDLMHYGHKRLLERAKALGDYLIVGVTSDAYDKQRGKINGCDSLYDRIKHVESLGIADEIIVEEYEGQKIDDIIKYGVDIFTVGSDWEGKFDYLNEYCKVIYLDRTEGVSSTNIRSINNNIKIGIIGDSTLIPKLYNETHYVNGVEISGLCITNNNPDKYSFMPYITNNYDELLDRSDAVYVVSHIKMHYTHVKEALLKGKHVVCESPIASNIEEANELLELARSKKLVLMDSIKTAYSLAYQRMISYVKSGKIGEVVSVDATCTSIDDNINDHNLGETLGSFASWGPTALLPIIQLLGTDYKTVDKFIRYYKDTNFDTFVKLNFHYETTTATLKVANAVKSEGELIISGTKGYIYVPAPWWKSGYFEVRFENQNENQKVYYKNDGEGIRLEIVAFLNLINVNNIHYITRDISREFVKFYSLVKKN